MYGPLIYGTIQPIQTAPNFHPLIQDPLIRIPLIDGTPTVYIYTSGVARFFTGTSARLQKKKLDNPRDDDDFLGMHACTYVRTYIAYNERSDPFFHVHMPVNLRDEKTGHATYVRTYIHKLYD